MTKNVKKESEKVAEKRELETIQNLNDDELKERAEEKKNDENTSEEEKKLIAKAKIINK